MNAGSPEGKAKKIRVHPRSSAVPTSVPRRLAFVLEAVRIQESLFALPFAYVGMLLAARGLPSLHSFIWVTLAMIGARNAGMSVNRVIDREMDAQNPRTANRHLPRGLLQPWELTAFGVLGLALFSLAAAELNP